MRNIQALTETPGFQSSMGKRSLKSWGWAGKGWFAHPGFLSCVRMVYLDGKALSYREVVVSRISLREVCRERHRELGAYLLPHLHWAACGVGPAKPGGISFLEASGMPHTCPRCEVAHSEAASAHPSATRGCSAWEHSNAVLGGRSREPATAPFLLV